MSQASEIDDITSKVIEYILETDKEFYKSKFIARRLNENYEDIDASSKKVGSRFRFIQEYLELEEDEIKDAYTSGTSWNLKLLRENYGEELRDLLEKN